MCATPFRAAPLQCIAGAGAAAPLKGAASGGRKTSLIREWRELFTQVGDNQALLSSLKDSPYYKPFADTAAVYEGQFSLLDECCQRLNMIQVRDSLRHTRRG